MADAGPLGICTAQDNASIKAIHQVAPGQSTSLNAPADCQIHKQDCDEKEDHRNTPLIRQRSEEMLDHRAHATKRAAATGEFVDSIMEYGPAAHSRAGGKGQTEQCDKGPALRSTL